MVPLALHPAERHLVHEGRIVVVANVSTVVLRVCESRGHGRKHMCKQPVHDEGYHEAVDAGTEFCPLVKGRCLRLHAQQDFGGGR